jgi:pantothenate kinase-related protein Tda10
MGTQAARSFQANDAKRERVPLLLGLIGPSGGGKTYSALRLATA